MNTVSDGSDELRRLRVLVLTERMYPADSRLTKAWEDVKYAAYCLRRQAWAVTTAGAPNPAARAEEARLLAMAADLDAEAEAALAEALPPINDGTSRPAEETQMGLHA